MPGQQKEMRLRYRHFLTIPTRWMDNDTYGHVNNVTYYSYFDTAANSYLVEAGGFDPQNAPVIGVVVESMCRYQSPLAFPEKPKGEYVYCSQARRAVPRRGMPLRGL